MNWEWLLTSAILLWLGLTIWSAITRQKIKDILEDIKDFISESKEE